MPLVDAHLHLPASPDATLAILAANETGTRLFSCTVNAGEAAVNLKLREEQPSTIIAFVGVHPSDVTEHLPSELLASEFEKAEGIGEIGLDEKYSSTSAGSLQMRSFADQLALAERMGKPVQVHSRGSASLVLDVLSTYRLSRVLMHWFDDEAALGRVSSSGYFVSVGPSLVYSKRTRRIAASMPFERLLTETDSPVQFAPLGGASGPGLIPSVLFSLAEVRRVSFESAEERVSANAATFLGRDL